MCVTPLTASTSSLGQGRCSGLWLRLEKSGCSLPPAEGFHAVRADRAILASLRVRLICLSGKLLAVLSVRSSKEEKASVPGLVPLQSSLAWGPRSEVQGWVIHVFLQ